MLVHVPEPRHLDTPFHSAAKMGSPEIIEVRTYHFVPVCCFTVFVFDVPSSFVIRSRIWTAIGQHSFYN